MKRFQNNSVKSVLICFGLVTLTAFAYWPVKDCGFVEFDDQVYVTNNPQVQQGLTRQGVAWSFIPGHAANWHPLTWLSHMLDVELFGVKSGAHHLVNLSFHIINSILLFLLFRKMTGTMWRSGFVAALFALHPLHVESVAWISERKDVLSAFFGLITIWYYVEYVRSPKSNGANRRWMFYFLALFFFAVGLMSKPMLVTIPCVLLLLDFWPLERLSKAKNSKSKVAEQPLASLPRWGRLFVEKIPFFAFAAIASVLTVIAQKNVGAVMSMEQMTFSHRIENALVGYIGYLGKMLWPRNLAVFYPVQAKSDFTIICFALLIFAISLAAFKLVKLRPYILIGWLWFLGMLVPVIGLVQVGNQAMADRYTYLPLIGIFVMIAWAATDFLKRRRMVLVSTAIVLIGLCTVLTREQVSHWKNTVTLFEKTLRSTERNYWVMGLLAAQYLNQGRFDEAGALIAKSLEIEPRSVQIAELRTLWRYHTARHAGTLAAKLETDGKLDEALKAYTRALELDPKNSCLENNIGFLLLKQKQFDVAIQHLTTALKIRPDFPEPHYNMGNVYFAKGDIVEAISHYEEAVRLQPEYAEAHCVLGMALFKLGKLDVALSHTETAIRLKPDFALAQHQLSEILFTFGRFAEAEEHSREAVQLQPKETIMLNALGLTLAAQRKWSEAEEVFSRALQLTEQAGDQSFSEEISNNLLSVCKNKPLQ